MNLIAFCVCENNSICETAKGKLWAYFPTFDNTFSCRFQVQSCRLTARLGTSNLKLETCNMKIYEGLDKFKGAKNAAVTIGTFDGVHLGHQKIIQQLKEGAESVKGESVIFTFYPHPRMVLNPEDDSLKLLSTEEEKKELLEKFGVEHLIIHPFTKEFSRITYTEYVRDILVNKLKVKKLIIGYNHHFGRNREGSFKELKKLAPTYGFELEKIPAQDLNKIEISSTKIRKLLNQAI